MSKIQTAPQPLSDARRLVRRVVTTEEIYECPVSEALDGAGARGDDGGQLEGLPDINEKCRCVSSRTTVDERDDVDVDDGVDDDEG